MHREYILLNGFRKDKKGFTAGFHVPLMLGTQNYIISSCVRKESQICIQTDNKESKRWLASSNITIWNLEHKLKSIS